MKPFKSLAVLGVCVLAHIGVQAQDSYPTRPITIVVPFPAGGAVDVLGRMVAEKMSAQLKQPFIVENRRGASASIGATAVAQAAPDGYTLLLGGPASHVTAPTILRKLPYDPIKSFEPVGQVSNGPLVLTVGAGVQAKSLKALDQELKVKGSRANYASNGNGTMPHLGGEMFKRAGHYEMAHIPYSGGPAVVTALLAGEVDITVNNIPAVMPMLKAGRLRGLATTGLQRSKALPDLPTMAESGFKDFDANAWFGIFAPAGTPPQVIGKLTEALAASLRDPDLKARMLAQGDEATYRAPQDFAAFVKHESQRWRALIEQAHITLDQ